MAIDQNRLMQSVYDTIFEALTTTSSGVGNGRPIEPRQNTYLSLALPGNPVDVAQFANACSPTNPEGSVYAAENYSLFVDDIPTLSPRHVASGVSIDQPYNEVINANVVPPSPNPVAEDAYNRAYNLRYTDGVDYDDQGRQVTVRVESSRFGSVPLPLNGRESCPLLDRPDGGRSARRPSPGSAAATSAAPACAAVSAAASAPACRS